MLDKEKLRGKIDSPELYDDVLGTSYKHMAHSMSTPWGSISTPWWVAREKHRLDVGIYEATETLETINASNPCIVAHISQEDRTMVAYTPDADAGRRDKQVKLSIGRLLSRLYPQLPDEVVANCVSQHLGDLTNEVEWIQGGEAIEEAYKAGISTCMSKDVWTISPVRVYDAPNIKLAVLRDKDGVINARSLVFEASDTDKRYIRIYGDQKLQRRLKNLGYVPGNWIGAKFKTIKSATSGYYIMPYLDADGGMSNLRGSNVALLDGQLTGVTETAYSMLRSKFGSRAAVNCSGTTGQFVFKDIPTKDFIVTDFITKEKVSILSAKLYEYYYDVDKKGYTTIEQDCKSVTTFSEVTNSWVQGKALEDVPTFSSTVVSYRSIIDNPVNRLRAGFTLISKNPYYEYDEWVQKVVTDKKTGLLIKKEDSKSILAEDGKLVYYHKSVVDKNWVKVASLKAGVDTYAISSDIVVKTLSNRKVVPGHHAIVKTYTGEWAFERTTKSKYLLRDIIYWSPAYQQPPNTSPGSLLYRLALREKFNENLQFNTDWYQAAILTARISERVYINERRFYFDGADSQRIADELGISTKELWALLKDKSLYSPVIRLVEIDELLGIVQAEALAEEAPHRLVPAVVVTETEELETV